MVHSKDSWVPDPNPNVLVVDLTQGKYACLSPRYPIGDIPVPFSKGSFSMTVEV